MAAFTKKNPSSILLVLTIFAIALEFTSHVYYGYYSSGNILIILFMGLLAVIRYVLIIICAVVTVLSIIKHEHRFLFTLLWIFMAILGQIPKGHFETLGALLSLYNSSPTQVRNDAKMLLDEYTPMTCIGYQPERPPCNDPVPHDRLPSSIQHMHAGNVLILEDYVLIEKFGLQGVFRGFVIFRNDSDPWKNEKSITLKGGCNICWRIRIIDDLYWYHSDPLSPPIFTSPLN
jgi:hypothetical protein